MKILVISCSHSPDSRSRELARRAMKLLEGKGPELEFIDLSTRNLPVCDGAACYEHPEVQSLTNTVTTASAILMSVPIYNYDVNAAAKNFLELTGSAWRGKIVGFLCAAGGQSSYMSVMSFANSLMLDFRCLIVPRFVYAPYAEIDDPEFGEGAIEGRIDELVTEILRLAKALG